MADLVLRPALLVRLVVVLLFGVVLAGCGGGGGGGGIVYDGVTTQASVTDGNAGELSGGAYRTGDAGTSVSAPIATATTSSAPTSVRSLRIATVARDALSKIDMQGGGTAHATGATAQDSIPGACGGSASYSINYNASTGSFSGTFSFNNYCEAGETVSGNMSFSGQLDVATEAFISFQIDVSNLGITGGSDSFAISGSIAVAFPNASEMTVTQTFNIRDGSGKVYRVENFVVTVDIALDEIELVGRFYHPDHGYVVVTTNTAFDVPFGSSVPESGSMTITGTGSSAELVATGGGAYRLDVDLGDDGSVDITRTGFWVDL